MDIRIAQFNPIVGDLNKNAARILSIAKENNDADIIIFPECALSGYPIEDLGLNDSFRKEVTSVADKLNDLLMSLDVATVYGTPYRTASDTFYNAAFFIDVDKHHAHFICKKDLPNYGVFDEKRVFSSDMGYHPPVEFRGRRFTTIICEDGWNGEVDYMVKSWEFDSLIWLNGSPYEPGKFKKRVSLAERLSNLTVQDYKHKCSVFYANLVGAEDEIVFDGKSFFLEGDELTVMDGFREYTETFITDLCHIDPSLEFSYVPHEDSNADIYNSLVLGTRDFLEKQGFKSVVLGYSGGVDSGIVAAIACDAVGPENVHLVRLPSKFSSSHSLSDAENGAMRLGAKLRTIDIEPVVESLRTAYWSTRAGCNHWDWEQKELTGVSDENLQARARGTLLMAISNQEGHILLTTGNKSEVSVGYSTLYGDMSGGFNPIKDCYKTTVWELCRYRNSLNARDLLKFGFLGNNELVVPEEIINKPPSAELSEGQFDENSLPPYPVLDEILSKLIEFKMGRDSIVKIVECDEETVDKVINLVYRSEYKRRQAAPGIKITGMLHGRDRRVPIVNKWRK